MTVLNSSSSGEKNHLKCPEECPMVSIFNCNLENQQCECIIMLSHFHLHISFFTTIQHQPYRIENYNQRVDEEEPTKKKVKYENVSPAEVEHIPQDRLLLSEIKKSNSSNPRQIPLNLVFPTLLSYKSK
jgi:hypothetical protein